MEIHGITDVGDDSIEETFIMEEVFIIHTEDLITTA